jgi:hypothetical protein
MIWNLSQIRRSADRRLDGLEIQAQFFDASHDEGSAVKLVTQRRVRPWSAAGVDDRTIGADLLRQRLDAIARLTGLRQNLDAAPGSNIRV